MPVTRTLGNRDGQMLRTCQPSLAKTASFQVDEKPYLREIKWIETEKDATHTPGHAPHTHPAHTSNRHKDNKELGTEHTAPCLVTQHLHLGGVEEPSLSSWVLPWQVVVEAGAPRNAAPAPCSERQPSLRGLHSDGSWQARAGAWEAARQSAASSSWSGREGG